MSQVFVQIMVLNPHLYKQLDEGEITATELLNQSFKMIRDLNPSINAVISKYSTEEQSMCSQFIESNSAMSKILKGIPLLVKDAIPTPFYHTYGGYETVRSHLDESPVIDNITSSGGTIVGKTNVPIDAMDYQTFNATFGTTNHPLDLNLTPGGSSGGSAAAVRSGMVDLAIGSDFGGSLRQPASFCGIYSFKPAFESFPATGHIGVGETNNYQLTIGPMSSSLFGTELLLQAMKGNKRVDWSNQETDELSGNLKLLVSRTWDGMIIDEKISQLIHDHFSQLDEDNVEINFLDQFSNYRDYLTLHRQFYEVFNGNNPQQFDHQSLIEEKERLQYNILNHIEGYDAWINPVVATLPYPHNLGHQDIVINGEAVNYWVANGSYCLPFNVVGFPVITLPIGTVNQLPVGIQVIGRPDEEDHLFKTGYLLDNLMK